jgi:hypothetical protein
MNNISKISADNFFNEIMSSFEEKVQNIQTAFQSSEYITESSHSLFDNVHHCLEDLKSERAVLNTKLSECLAKNGSLRKKDYNTMMSVIIDSLDKKETDAEKEFQNFIETEKEIAHTLKASILGLKDISSEDANDKIVIFKKQLSDITKLQECRKESVMKIFTDFQDMHNKIMESLKDIIEKEDHIIVKDVKKIRDRLLKEIN